MTNTADLYSFETVVCNVRVLHRTYYTQPPKMERTKTKMQKLTNMGTVFEMAVILMKRSVIVACVLTKTQKQINVKHRNCVK